MKNRIRFISVCENIDTAVKEDDFVPFRNIMNDWYAKDISTKTKASLYTKAKAGERMITVPIYGYKYDENKQWIIDEPAAEIVRRIFRMYLSGVGISTIARTLTEEGVDRPLKYKRGQDSEFPDWSRESIRSILTHQEYCGDTVNFKTLKLSYKSKKQIRRPKEEYLIFLDTHPAIITREEYEDISMLLEQQKRQTNKKSRKESLLRGFLICGDCNCNLIAQHAKVKTGFSTSYVCSTYHHHFRRCTSHSINEKLIIAKLIDTLQKLTEMYRNGELISYLDTVVFDDVKREQNETNEQLIKVNKRLEEIDVVIKNLYEDKVLGNISNEIFLDLHNSFREEKETLRNQVYSLSNKAVANRDNSQRINRFVQIIKEFSECEAITADTLNRAVIFNTIDHIVIGKRVPKEEKNQRQIDIYFKYVGLLGNFPH